MKIKQILVPELADKQVFSKCRVNPTFIGHDDGCISIEVVTDAGDTFVFENAKEGHFNTFDYRELSSTHYPEINKIVSVSEEDDDYWNKRDELFTNAHKQFNTLFADQLSRLHTLLFDAPISDEDYLKAVKGIFVGVDVGLI
ncbi:hypothetical protein VCSRO154_3243 [Vibrio metoecus]|nr:hypothetical protein VCSRO154_3243 [Vibrio metoecus]